MELLPYIAQAILLVSVSYVLWRLFRPFVVRSSLYNLRGPPKASWWNGNFDQIFDRNGFQFHIDLCRKYGSVVKVYNTFGRENLYVTDPLALHHVIVKDQYIYEETDGFIVNNQLVFGTSLLSTLGDHHKKQRKTLNPVFSLKHMRGLLPIFHPIAHKLNDILSEKVRRGEEEINVMLWVSRAALEYIGQGGLGYTFEALDEKATNAFSDAVKSMGPLLFNLNFWRQFLPVVSKFGTSSLRRKIADWLPWKDLHDMKDMVDLMHNTSIEILQQKKVAIAHGDESSLEPVGKGKDIMSILLKENALADDADKLPEEEVIGQMSTFIFAGHETTSGAICRTLHLLAHHQDVQQKLREEVTQAIEEYGDSPYDVLMGLPYLDAVCRETLRAYPPAPMVRRIARKDIIMPLRYPLTTSDGKEIKEIPVPKGTEVIVGILATNRSKLIWGEDADVWRPERWLEPLPETVTQAHLPGVYSNLMTFIGGGRACIGFKFAEMELKLMLANLLKLFVFSPPSKDIQWNMGNLMSPIVKGSDSRKPQMPLTVKFVEKN